MNRICLFHLPLATPKKFKLTPMFHNLKAKHECNKINKQTGILGMKIDHRSHLVDYTSPFAGKSNTKGNKRINSNIEKINLSFQETTFHQKKKKTRREHFKNIRTNPKKNIKQKKKTSTHYHCATASTRSETPVPPRSAQPILNQKLKNK